MTGDGKPESTTLAVSEAERHFLPEVVRAHGFPFNLNFNVTKLLNIHGLARWYMGSRSRRMM